MRSRSEILFRLKQEAMNLRLFVLGAGHTNSLPDPGPLASLPDPSPVIERLRKTSFAETVVSLADGVLKHRFKLLTLEASAGDKIDWQADPTHPERNGLGWRRRVPSRLVPYMDVERFGDYKVIWELNRQQHMPLLAQAWRFTGRREFLEEIGRQIVSWRDQNPLLAGINWASALEPAFRVLSWVWTWHFASADLDIETRRHLIWAIEEHARFLEYNLSIYHSPNTHLIGEALALEAVGTLFPHFERAARWRKLGGETLDRELRVQIRPDGGHFEQSTYYHVYTLDMFLFHAVLTRRHDKEFLDRLRSMARYLAAITGPSRRIPLIGDDDGGRLFHPYGERDQFCRATLTVCGLMLDQPEWIGTEEDAAELAACWIGESALDRGDEAPGVKTASTLFPDTGLAIMESGDAHVVIDAGPFGPGSGGHSHADTLSLTVRRDREEILIDPGTYTYILDPRERERFRGTAMHNTIRVDGRNQAVSAGPFRWLDHPLVKIAEWQTSASRDLLSATCRYRGLCHARAVWFQKPDVLMICDHIDGPPGEHTIEQFWHPGVAIRPEPGGRLRLGATAWMSFPPGAIVETGEDGEFGWRSPGLGTKSSAYYVRIEIRGLLPILRWTVLDLKGAGELMGDDERAVYRRGSIMLSLRAAVEGNGCIKLVE